MTRKIDEALISDLAKRYVTSNLSLSSLSKIVKINPDTLSRKFRAIGINIEKRSGAPNKLPLNKNVIEAFKSGESIFSISKRFGISRPAITRMIKDSGLSTRNGSEANLIRFKDATLEEKRKITKKANEAKRGVPNTREQLIKRALRKDYRVGKFESEMYNFFKEIYGPIEDQFVIDTYNVDMLVRGVAVEIRSGKGIYPYLSKKSDRIKKILEAGYSILCVDVNSIGAIELGRDYIISHFEEMSRQPPSASKYRMISCRTYSTRVVKGKNGKLTSKKVPEYLVSRIVEEHS